LWNDWAAGYPGAPEKELLCKSSDKLKRRQDRQQAPLVRLKLKAHPTLRIPGKATTLSGAWRPRDPVDDDRGGARA
jgi:hypothetical protein